MAVFTRSRDQKWISATNIGTDVCVVPGCSEAGVPYMLASFKFSMGGLAGQVRAPARRSEYLTRVEKAS
jgi:hypothetical protein